MELCSVHKLIKGQACFNMRVEKENQGTGKGTTQDWKGLD
jgi:hypothetical protein